MKEQGIYTIRDKVADEFGPIYQAVNDNVARRQFDMLAQQTTHPKDYELFKLGTYDPGVPKVYGFVTPKIIELDMSDVPEENG